MSEVVVVAAVTAADGKADAVRHLMVHELIPATHAETGCVTFALHVDVADPNKLVLIERWVDRSALDVHLAADHLGTFRAKVADLTDGPAQVFVLEPLPAGAAGKGTLAGA